MLDRLSKRLGVDQHQGETSRELARNVAVEHLVRRAAQPATRFMSPVRRGSPIWMTIRPA
jgi:hypothetical protein